jgi:antitoxin component of MazEF toxin-antitoxin module
MTKTLTKHGNSLALIIDKPILDLLKIDAETPLEITTDGKRLMIAPEVRSGIERHDGEVRRYAEASCGVSHRHRLSDRRGDGNPSGADRTLWR